MRATKKRLTLTKKTLFLYQKQSFGQPTISDPTMTSSITSNSGNSFKP